jgi:hypothetical protein
MHKLTRFNLNGQKIFRHERSSKTTEYNSNYYLWLTIKIHINNFHNIRKKQLEKSFLETSTET